MKTLTLASIFGAAAASLIFLTGCETPAPEPITIHYEVPESTLDSTLQATQEKEGCSVTVEPYLYSPKISYTNEYRVPFTVQCRKTPKATVEPNYLAYKVRMRNNTEQIIFLNQSLVQFLVSGKATAVERARYAEFLASAVPPRQEMEFTIGGPDLSQIPDRCQVTLNLFGIVTASDAAGNPTKRTNYTWVFDVSKVRKSQQGNIVVENVSLSQQDRQKVVNGGGQFNWVSVPGL